MVVRVVILVVIKKNGACKDNDKNGNDRSK